MQRSASARPSVPLVAAKTVKVQRPKQVPDDDELGRIVVDD